MFLEGTDFNLIIVFKNKELCLAYISGHSTNECCINECIKLKVPVLGIIGEAVEVKQFFKKCTDA